MEPDQILLGDNFPKLFIASNWGTWEPRMDAIVMALSIVA